MNRCKKYGEEGNELLIFFTLQMNGKYLPTVQIRRKTRKEIAKDLKNFRRARRAVPASSLEFCNNFPFGSWRWLACHCGYLKILSQNKLKKIKFKNPCLRSILKFAETR